MNGVRWALLMEDSQGNLLAVGRFKNTDSARAWQDRNPHLEDRVRGVVALVSTGDPWVSQ